MKVGKSIAFLLLATAGSEFAAEKVTLKSSYRPGTQDAHLSPGTDHYPRRTTEPEDGGR